MRTWAPNTIPPSAHVWNVQGERNSRNISKHAIYLSKLSLFKDLLWGKKVFSQPPIVQVLPLQKMREACNFHHRYTSTMRDKIRKKNPEKSHCRIFKEFICKLWWKILQCDFSGFFFLILSLIVEVYLWWKLQASLIFLSGRTCTIGGWLNTFLPHSTWGCSQKLDLFSLNRR